MLKFDTKLPIYNNKSKEEDRVCGFSSLMLLKKA